MLHTFPFLIPNLGIALKLAYAVVVCELIAIAFIRYRFMGGKLANTIVQVVIGGGIVFANWRLARPDRCRLSYSAHRRQRRRAAPRGRRSKLDLHRGRELNLAFARISLPSASGR